MGRCLIEKTERNEVCPVCQKPFVAGEEVWEYECNHIVHCTCLFYHPTDLCSVKRHLLDGRYTIRTIVQRGSRLPKKLRGRQLTEFLHGKERALDKFMRGKGVASMREAFKAPKLPLADMNRLLGVGPSSAAPPQVRPPPMSEHKCQLCGATLRADSAIYRHKVCNHVFCFSCVEQNRSVCPACRAPFRNEVERIDRDL